MDVCKSHLIREIKNTIEKPELNNECPSCRNCKWIKFDRGYFCQKCGIVISKKPTEIRDVHTQDQKNCTRLPYAKKKYNKHIFLR